MTEQIREFIRVNVVILTVSDTRTTKTDKSGPLLAERVKKAGHQLLECAIVKDDIYQIRALVSKWIFDPMVNVIITTGGTGITGRDGTPEAITPLLDKQIPGFGEMFRSLSYQTIKTSSLQSRALAGIANASFIFVLPGSVGACKDAWDNLIVHQLDYRTRPCNLVELMPRLAEY